MWGEQDLGDVDATLPFPFWRMSLRRRRSPQSGERQVSPLTRVSPCLAPLFSAPCELLAVSQVCDKTTTALSADDLI
jgi:hypothetical protein